MTTLADVSRLRRGVALLVFSLVAASAGRLSALYPGAVLAGVLLMLLAAATGTVIWQRLIAPESRHLSPLVHAAHRIRPVDLLVTALLTIISMRLQFEIVSAGLLSR
jgi:hypothetical protein